MQPRLVRENTGFTLIEVVVAILILAIGVLALGSVSASVSRLIGSGHISTNVAVVSGAVMEWLVASACEDGLVSGDTLVGPIGLAWEVTRTASGSHLTVASESSMPGIATDTLRHYVTCAGS